MFLGQMETNEARQTQPAFQPKLNDENSREERQRVLERLDKFCKQVTHNRRVRIVRMWHGCKKAILPNLLSNGFAALGTLDDGWYGKAMYFTSSAKYATRYCGETDGCLIMCYILLLNPFPVVAADVPLTVSPTSFRLYGKGNHKNYQYHYIPVSPVGGSDTWDYRPPTSGTDDAMYDELAVFQETNILPQIVIHFKDGEIIMFNTNDNSKGKKCFPGRRAAILSMCVNDNNDLVATSLLDDFVRIYSLNQQTLIKELNVIENLIYETSEYFVQE
ncbi:unnamed protein product [Rotaria sordida]|uniref:PARP catalytic domain-containing protein n=2 Tax=Rotaria sordida TaxID=392033 RepID=A0A819BMT4_9BILA|nr:unnamed protein product [Rotaria sordida]CAF3799517.1 unnamed protein product [Rotaria sordida]